MLKVDQPCLLTCFVVSCDGVFDHDEGIVCLGDLCIEGETSHAVMQKLWDGSMPKCLSNPFSE